MRSRAMNLKSCAALSVSRMPPYYNNIRFGSLFWVCWIWWDLFKAALFSAYCLKWWVYDEGKCKGSAFSV